MVLDDQTALRLAEKQEKRTDWVMNRWGSRNGRVSELLHLLEGLELLRPRDVILKGEPSPLPQTLLTFIVWLTLLPFKGVSSLKPPPPPPPRSSPHPPLPFAPAPFVLPSESPGWLPTAGTDTRSMFTVSYTDTGTGGASAPVRT